MKRFLATTIAITIAAITAGYAQQTVVVRYIDPATARSEAFAANAEYFTSLQRSYAAEQSLFASWKSANDSALWRMKFDKSLYGGDSPETIYCNMRMNPDTDRYPTLKTPGEVFAANNHSRDAELPPFHSSWRGK